MDDAFAKPFEDQARKIVQAMREAGAEVIMSNRDIVDSESLAALVYIAMDSVKENRRR